jgi:hypothetical protein
MIATSYEKLSQISCVKPSRPLAGARVTGRQQLIPVFHH